METMTATVPINVAIDEANLMMMSGSEQDGFTIQTVDPYAASMSPKTAPESNTKAQTSDSNILLGDRLFIKATGLLRLDLMADE